MTKPRVIFFDIESRKWASDLRPDDPDAGWDDLRAGKGGASAICLYDTRDNWLYTYDDHNPEVAARHLEVADVVVGFCSEKFDIPCLEGLVHRRIRLKNHIDIYVEIVRTNAERGVIGQKGDFTLDAISRRNLGRGKIDHGSNAKELARTGQWGKLFNYCADDVHLTRDLFAKMCKDGGLINLRGKFLSLPTPDWIRSWVEDS